MKLVIEFGQISTILCMLFLLPFVGSPSNLLVLLCRGLRHLQSASLSVGWSVAVEVGETCILGITPIRRLCRGMICTQCSIVDASTKIVKFTETARC
jgi:hypothetical protein